MSYAFSHLQHPACITSRCPYKLTYFPGYSLIAIQENSWVGYPGILQRAVAQHHTRGCSPCALLSQTAPHPIVSSCFRTRRSRIGRERGIILRRYLHANVVDMNVLQRKRPRSDFRMHRCTSTSRGPAATISHKTARVQCNTTHRSLARSARTPRVRWLLIS